MPIEEGVKPVEPPKVEPVDHQPPSQPALKPGPAPDNKGGNPWDTEKAGLLKETQKERTARATAEKLVQKLQSELGLTRKQVQALTGSTPADESTLENNEILGRLKQIIPGLDRLLDDNKLKGLDQLLTMLPGLQRTQEHYWGRHGLNSLKGIEKKIGEAFGELNEKQVKQIRSAYVVECEENDEFRLRHENDPEGLIEEFANEWVENWFEPSKRRVLATEVGRNRPVPGGRDRSLVNTAGKKIDVNNESEAMEAIVGSMKGRGISFGR